ncbi:hypothetical protein H2200_007558 [Cladophialophora chaetospira]|uniref:Uncharacterized protein n=1 Tax=Cladophialophora chaetospira TaxID=386627 RepID=A0AA39CGQ3_9EURO|nr:hypothetical protein H2200_007558 [Cladophialophora chaetospira]
MHLLKIIITVITTWYLDFQERTTDLVRRFGETAVRPFENFLAIDPSPEHKDAFSTVFATVTSTVTATPTTVFSTTTYADGNVAVVATAVPTLTPVALPPPDVCLAPFAWANWEDVTFCISEAEFGRLSASATALWETPTSQLLRSLLGRISDLFTSLRDTVTSRVHVSGQWSQQMFPIVFATPVTGWTFKTTPAKITRGMRNFWKSLSWSEVILCYVGPALALFLLLGTVRVLADRHIARKERLKKMQGHHGAAQHQNTSGYITTSTSMAQTSTLALGSSQAGPIQPGDRSALMFLLSYIPAFFRKLIESFQGKWTNYFEYPLRSFCSRTLEFIMTAGMLICDYSDAILRMIVFEVAPACILIIGAVFITLLVLLSAVSLIGLCAVLVVLLFLIALIIAKSAPVLDKACKLWCQGAEYVRQALEGIEKLPPPSQAPVPSSPSVTISQRDYHYYLSREEALQYVLDLIGPFPGRNDPEKLRTVIDFAEIFWYMKPKPAVRSEGTQTLPAQSSSAPAQTQTSSAGTQTSSADAHTAPTQTSAAAVIENESLKLQVEALKMQLKQQEEKHEEELQAQPEPTLDRSTVTKLQNQIKALTGAAETHKAELAKFSWASQDAAKQHTSEVTEVKRALEQEQANHANTEKRRAKAEDEFFGADARANDLEFELEELKDVGVKEQAMRAQLVKDHEIQIGKLESERDQALSDWRSERHERQLAEQRAATSEKSLNAALNSLTPAPVSTPITLQQQSANVADGQGDGMVVDVPAAAIATDKETEMCDAPTISPKIDVPAATAATIVDEEDDAMAVDVEAAAAATNKEMSQAPTFSPKMEVTADDGNQQQSSSMEISGPSQTINNQTYFSSTSFNFQGPSTATSNNGAPTMRFGANQVLNKGFQRTATQSNQPAGGIFGNPFSRPLPGANQTANNGFQFFGPDSNQPSTGNAGSVLASSAKEAASKGFNGFKSGGLAGATSSPFSFGSKQAVDKSSKGVEDKHKQPSNVLSNSTFAPSPLRASKTTTGAPEASGSAKEPATPAPSDKSPAQVTQKKKWPSYINLAGPEGVGILPRGAHLQSLGPSPQAPASPEAPAYGTPTSSPPVLTAPVDDHGNPLPSPAFIPNMTAPVSKPAYVSSKQSNLAAGIKPGSSNDPNVKEMMASVTKAPQEEYSASESDEDGEYEDVPLKPITEHAETNEPEKDRRASKAKDVKGKNWVERPLERKRVLEDDDDVDDEEQFEETPPVLDEEQRGRATSEHSTIQNAADPLPAERRFGTGDYPQISDDKLRQTHRGRDGTYEHPVPFFDDPNEYIHEFMPYTPDLRGDDPRTPQGCRDLNCIKQAVADIAHDCVLEQILKMTRELEAKREEEERKQERWRQEKARLQQQREQDGEIFEV